MKLTYEIKNIDDMRREVVELTELVANLQNQISDIKESAQFLTTEEVSLLTGIGMPQVREIFKRPDFPYTDYGKGKMVMLKAFIEYFMKPVKHSDFK